jgi:hypothetical protein
MVKLGRATRCRGRRHSGRGKCTDGAGTGAGARARARGAGAGGAAARGTVARVSEEWAAAWVRESERRSEWEKRRRRRQSVGIFYFFAECPWSSTRQRFFLILKYALPSARSGALGKDDFAECPLGGTRQIYFYNSLPSVNQLALGKGCFAECHFLTLGKVHFYFFYFPNQNFCGMFLHYIDLHVPFWDN